MNDASAHPPLSVLRTIVVLLLLIATAWLFVAQGLATIKISRLLYVQIDLPGFVFAAALLLAAALIAWRMPARFFDWVYRPENWPVRPWHMALVALILTAIGVHAVYFGYAFSIDEWMTRLQAELFRDGMLSGVVPEQWRDYGRAIYQIYAAYDPVSGRVASDYRPGMAALYALFDSAGLGLYTSAILNALSIPLVGAVALQLWPGRRDIAVLAAFLLFSSQQALAMAMTSYAMPAHMFLNLLWLLAFLRMDWRGAVAAALIAGLTASLHQIHVHAFFAAPFFLLLLRPFRPGLLVFYALAYAAAHAFVYSWDWWSVNRYMTTTTVEARSLVARVLRIARLPSLEDVLTVYANLVRMVAWQNLALVPMIAAAGSALVYDRWLRLLGLSIVISLVPYVFLMPDQGHGWGYRYLHGLIGPLALIGAYGGASLLRSAGNTHGIAFLAMLAILSLGVMVPVRAWQIHQQVRPFALATAYVSAQDADVVLVDDMRIVLGDDIPRNSALKLSPPIAMSLWALSPAQIEELCRSYDVVYLGPDQFPKEFGLLLYPESVAADAPGYAAKTDALRACGFDI